MKPQIAADPLRPLEGLHDAIPPPKIVIDPEGWTPKAPKGVLAPDVRPWTFRQIVLPHIDAPLDVVSPTTRLRSAIRDGPASARAAIARSGLDAPLPDWARAKKLEQLGPEYVGFDAFDDGAKILVAKHGDDLAAIRVAGFRVDVVPQASGWLPAYERRLRGRVRLLSTATTRGSRSLRRDRGLA